MKVWIARDYPQGMREGRLRVHFGNDESDKPIWYKDHWNTNGEFAINIPRELFPEIRSGEAIEFSYDKVLTEISSNKNINKENFKLTLQGVIGTYHKVADTIDLKTYANQNVEYVLKAAEEVIKTK